MDGLLYIDRNVTPPLKRRNDKMTDLTRFFNPRNVAVIGASSKKQKIGFKTFNNLYQGGFRGGMYPVNLDGEDVCGQKGFKKLSDISVEIDLALICIPARFVKDSLAECGKKNIPFVVIITSGFKEIGNVELEEELIEVAKEYKIRILGPNVFGMVYTPANLNAQFGPENILPGNVAIITQSGSLGIALMDRVFQEGIGVSALTSVGNKADLSDEEILDFLCQDENTKIILMYIEGLKDGREFIRKVKEISRKKPVIILKSGRSKAGAKAVASHTASLAGADSLFDSAFKQAGAIRAPTLREAIDWTRALNDLPLPEAEDVLVITNGGGFGILAIDEVGLSGLPLFYDMEWITMNLGPL
ncbi:MAG: CoA-binding protein, partial [Candidatus Thermoplasmatota archaeon]|nr:CoA-binding protein [Candidatus Thermoplasmatota archaeon]